MNVIKNVILLPFLPIRLAWKWSSASAINGQPSGCAHVLGTIIVAAILYSLIGWGCMKILGK